MECGEINLEVCSVAEEEGGVDRAVMCEMEEAEALAGMARCCFLGGRALEAVDQHTIVLQIESFVENIPAQLCSATGQSKSMAKSRQKLTEMEKEQRKLRRILANRKSARETMRRRKDRSSACLTFSAMLPFEGIRASS